MYNALTKLLEAGYQVTFRPLKKGNVLLTVEEAKNGTIKGVEVEMHALEWSLSDQGFTHRLNQASEELIHWKKSKRRAA